ncbi:Mediator of RNA polymerase II transcription subunit 27 [Chamberlinius hualienensis]
MELFLTPDVVMGTDGTLGNVDAVLQTLRALKLLRSNVSYIFESLSECPKSSQTGEGKEKVFLADLQQCLHNVTTQVRDLENAANSLVQPNASCNLSNCGLLSQDPSQERSALYLQMIQSYKWTDKVREFASHAASILSQNSLKRSGVITKRMRKAPQSSHNIPPQMVDNTLANFERHFPQMQLEFERSFGSSTILQLTIGKTLRAVVVLRSLIIEWVVVKAYNEETHTEDGKVDIWSSSRYKVFQKVTDHANAAMLHYYAPSFPDVAVKSFLLWLHSYGTLFTDPCQRCGNYLHNCIPPTWRDFRTLAAYHEACH